MAGYLRSPACVSAEGGHGDEQRAADAVGARISDNSITIFDIGGAGTERARSQTKTGRPWQQGSGDAMLAVGRR